MTGRKKTKLKSEDREAILMKELPVSVNIMGQEFEVCLSKITEYGLCELEKRKISIRYNLELKEAKETLFHECLHAAIGISGHSHILDETHSGLEEAIVRCLEHAFSHAIDIKKL